MVDQCVIDGKLSSLVALKLVKTLSLELSTRFVRMYDNTQEATVAADGLFRMRNAYHVLLINRIKTVDGGLT